MFYCIQAPTLGKAAKHWGENWGGDTCDVTVRLPRTAENKGDK